MHHQLPHRYPGFVRVPARELGPVIYDPIVVAKQPAIHEQRDDQRLDELRGGRDELDGVGVVRRCIAGTCTSTAGEPDDRLAVDVCRNA